MWRLGHFNSLTLTAAIDANTYSAGSFGALVHGPTGHYFYGMLDAKLPGTKPMTVASKVAIDQVRLSLAYERGHRR